jgi:WD40 repeat protein
LLLKFFQVVVSQCFHTILLDFHGKVIHQIKRRKKMLKNKNTTAIALVLMLSLTAFTVCLQYVSAQPTGYNDTFTYLSFRPNPVGVNQTLLINFWITPPMPQPGILARGYTVEITDPDGHVETLGPFDSIQADSSSWTEWTPKTIGTYEIKVIYPGQTIPIGTPYQTYTVGSPFDRFTTEEYIYGPSESPVAEVVVQAEQLPGYTATPLPTEYWSRPISIENREWSTLLGDWVQSGNSAGAHSYNQPYGGAPGSAHIYWVKTAGPGGIVGDQYGDATYGGNPPYEFNVARYMQLAVDGLGFYEAIDGIHCVDLTTGEELYVSSDLPSTRSSSTKATSQYWIVRAQGPPIEAYDPVIMQIGSTMRVWSAWTGDLLFEEEGMSGIFDPPYVYSTQTIDDQRYLIKWNTFEVFDRHNFTARIVYNVSYPLNGITAVEDGIGFYFGSGYASSRDSGAFDTETGQILWTKNLGNEYAAFSSLANLLESGVYVYPLYFGDPNQQGLRPLAGIDVKTGNVLFNDAITSYPWGSFWTYSVSGADGMAFYGTYDGYVHAFDVRTGDEVWKGGYIPAGYATPYGYQPYFSSIISGGGYVYAGNDEHSEGPPYYQGKQMVCLNQTTGETVWTISFWSPGFNIQGLIADGKFIATNYYDNRMYCFYKGQTETSVTASPKISVYGDSVLVEGMVTDQSPATNDDKALAKFPQGVPAVSEESMSSFMEYMYMQKAKPTNATGVKVTLTVIDPNNNCYDVATATSNEEGFYSATFTPSVPGKYTIYASFGGSESYWPSSAVTAINVENAPEPTQAPAATPAPMTDTYVLGLGAGAIVAIIAIGLVIILMLRKR